MSKEKIMRVILYFAGLLLLALGLILNTKVNLGVSPIVSVSFAVSEVFHLNFADMTLIWYSVLVLVEVGIHLLNKKGKMVVFQDLLQIPLSLVFTRFMNLFTALIPDGMFPKTIEGPKDIAFKVVFLIIAIILTGIGAGVSVSCKLIPNPGDGIVKALAENFHKKVGDMKNIFDISCVVITLTFGLLAQRRIIGIGIGTVCAMLGIGRVVAVAIHILNTHFRNIIEA